MNIFQQIDTAEMAPRNYPLKKGELRMGNFTPTSEPPRYKAVPRFSDIPRVNGTERRKEVSVAVVDGH